MEALAADDPASVGPYRLVRRLGSGGMGRVYLGHSRGDRVAAVKVVYQQLAADPEFRRRFAREVAAARRVGGRWTAPVLDSDIDAPVPWVATRYVPGLPLRDVVDTLLGTLPEPGLWVLVHGLARALEDFHSHGLVHRDIKPSNVLLTLDGPKVIDFGIARSVDASMLTRTGAMIGSPGYMAPEQVRGEPVTGAADVFALGAVLAHAATGTGPFAAGAASPHVMLYRVLHEEPELGSEHGPLTGELRELAYRCLAKDPARRPAPAEVAQAAASRGGATLDSELWLPPALMVRLRRDAAELLARDVPADAGKAMVGPSAPAPSAVRASRGRRAAWAAAVGLVITGALAVWVADPLSRDGRTEAGYPDVKQTTAPANGTPPPGNPEAPLYHLLPREVQQEGFLHVLAPTAAAPYSFVGDSGGSSGSGQVTGIEPQLLAAMSDHLGIGFRIEPFSDEDALLRRFSALSAGEKSVIAIGGYADTAATREEMSAILVDHYQQGYVLTSGEDTSADRLADLCGGTIVTWEGDYFRSLVRNESDHLCAAPITVHGESDITAMLASVRTGAADAAFVLYTETVGYLAGHEDAGAGLVVSREHILTGQYGIALPERDSDLAEVLRAALRAVIDDGTYLRILERWNVPDITIDGMGPTSPR